MKKTIIPHYKQLNNHSNLPLEDLLKKERRNTTRNLPYLENKISELNLKFGFLENQEDETKKVIISTKEMKMIRNDINLTEEDLILIRESLSNHILFKDLLTLDIM